MTSTTHSPETVTAIAALNHSLRVLRRRLGTVAVAEMLYRAADDHATHARGFFVQEVKRPLHEVEVTAGEPRRRKHRRWLARVIATAFFWGATVALTGTLAVMMWG